MATVNQLTVKLGADAKNLESGLSKAKKSLSNFSKKTEEISRKMTPLAIAAGGVGAALLKSASDAEETRGKLKAVFKDASDDAIKWAEQTGAAVGRSRVDLERWVSGLQDTFVPLGFAREEAAAMSKEVTELAIDLASFNNLNTDDVVRDLQSALVGNTETLRKFGVVANQAAIDQKAMEMGAVKVGKAFSAQDKAAAILALTIDGTSDAQGDAVRTGGSLANQMRALSADVQDLSAALGAKLIPIALGVVNGFRTMLVTFEKATTRFKAFKNEARLDQINNEISEHIKRLKELDEQGIGQGLLAQTIKKTVNTLQEEQNALLGDALGFTEELTDLDTQIAALVQRAADIHKTITGEVQQQAAAAGQFADNMGKAANNTAQVSASMPDPNAFVGPEIDPELLAARQNGAGGGPPPLPSGGGAGGGGGGGGGGGTTLSGDQAFEKEINKLHNAQPTATANQLIWAADRVSRLKEKVFRGRSAKNWRKDWEKGKKFDNYPGDGYAPVSSAYASMTGTKEEIAAGLRESLGVRALGGRVQRGRAFMVGELGSELFVPDQNGMIIPNHRLRAGQQPNNAGGGMVVSINIDGSKDPRVTAQEVRNALILLDKQGQLVSNPVTGRARF